MEVKLDYAIDTTARRTRYQVETWFFVPRSLGIDSDSYPRQQFYADMQAYLRFKTPDVSLASLVDEDDERSPLTRIRTMLHTATNGDDLDRDRLVHETRLLGCLARANLRDEAADLRAKIDRLEHPGRDRVLVDDVLAAAERVADECDRLLHDLRELRPQFLLARRPPWLRELFEFVDEYLSISAEAYFSATVSKIDADPARAQPLAAARARLLEVVVAEQAHRRAARYVSVLEPGEVNTTYVHRKSALKKFMSSVLFLEVRKRAEGRGAANIVAGIAAAVAMLFATVAAIWSQNAYGVNSFPFVVAIVISYVFKDRIKEWLRTYFATKVGRYLFDRSVEVYDPVAKVVVGRCRESFGYPSESDVPASIRRLRHADSTSMLEPETKPERVIRYVKDVTLRCRDIGAAHRRLGDVNDIIRFNFSSFLARMGEPMQAVETYEPQTDAVQLVACPKRYHVNVVMVLHAEGTPAAIERFRIVLDKHGIQRLQTVKIDNARALMAAKANGG